jgi:hypothetical protein
MSQITRKDQFCLQAQDSIRSLLPNMSPATESVVRPLDGSEDQRFVLISGLVFSSEISENRAADGGTISSSSSTYFRFDQEIIHGQ